MNSGLNLARDEVYARSQLDFLARQANLLLGPAQMYFKTGIKLNFAFCSIEITPGLRYEAASESTNVLNAADIFLTSAHVRLIIKPLVGWD